MKAGLVARPEDWRWSSARLKKDQDSPKTNVLQDADRRSAFAQKELADEIVGEFLYKEPPRVPVADETENPLIQVGSCQAPEGLRTGFPKWVYRFFCRFRPPGTAEAFVSISPAVRYSLFIRPTGSLYHSCYRPNGTES